MPRVSVVIPAYNAEATIEAAIHSALTQSMPPFEVIVVDDASRDRTPDVLRSFARRDPRVRMVLSSINGGPAAARNRGLAEARGDWIALLDSDDRFLPDRLRRLLAIAMSAEADLIADDLLVETQVGALPMFGWENEDRLTAAGFLKGNLPDPANPARSLGFLKPVIRRRFLQEHGLSYDGRLRFAEDFAFYLACLLAGANFRLVPVALYRYRQRPDSLTAQHSIEDLSRLLAFDRDLETRFAKRPLGTALRRHRRSIEQRLYWRLFIEAYKTGDWRRARAIWGHSPWVFAHISGNLASESVRRIARATFGQVMRRPPRAAVE